MSKVNKEEVFNKFKARSEREILLNKGVECYLGTEVINIRVLEWDASNAFEDEVARVFRKFEGFTSMTVDKKIDINKVMDILLSLLREDLISLANLATKGFVTLEKIREHKASKNDVICIIIESIKINYGYLKNLVALSNGLK